jgi:hypothetical protein
MIGECLPLSFRAPRLSASQASDIGVQTQLLLGRDERRL